MKLINRAYLDYNATSPLAKSVTKLLTSGEFVFGNPSSTHYEGKKSKRILRESADQIKEIFKLGRQYKVIFHSGATEGINTIFQTMAFWGHQHSKKIRFYFFTTDHSSVVKQQSVLSAWGHECILLPVDKHGNMNLGQTIERLKQTDQEGIKSVINITHVNNESGVVFPYEWASEIKNFTKAFVHLDCAQTVGKIKDWTDFPCVDAATFSGHKFGALKASGMGLVHESSTFGPLLWGGGQQDNLRSGTESPLAAQCLRLALEEMTTISFEQQTQCFLKWVDFFRPYMETGKILWVGQEAFYRNINTLYFIVPGQKSHNMVTAFDLAGIDISSGSACSSGLLKPSRVLMSMGYDKSQASSGIRFSWNPHIKSSELDDLFPRIREILNRF